VRWFVDGSISEVFVSGGYVATHRFYAPRDPQWLVSIDGGPNVRAPTAIEALDLGQPGTRRLRDR
jgi:hypothetical protein